MTFMAATAAGVRTTKKLRFVNASRIRPFQHDDKMAATAAASGRNWLLPATKYYGQAERAGKSKGRTKHNRGKGNHASFRLAVFA
jgi:hypothetical protein